MKPIIFLSALFLISNVCYAQLMEEPPQPEPVVEEASPPPTYAPPSPPPRYEPEPRIVEESLEPLRNNANSKTGVHPFTLGELKGLKDFETGEILVKPLYKYVDASYPGLYKLSGFNNAGVYDICLLYTSPSPRDS